VSTPTYRQKPQNQENTVIYTPRISEILKAYDEAGIEYIIQEDDRKEMEYEDAARMKPDSKQEFVSSIYRIKTHKRFVLNQASDEALIYYKRRVALRYNNTAVEDNRFFGVLMKPVTRSVLDEFGKIKKVEKTLETPFFSIPFTPQAVDDIIAQSLTDVDQFYLAQGTIQGPGFVQKKDIFQILNKDDFKEGTFEELWDMARMNYTNREPQLSFWRKERNDILRQAKNFKSMSTSSPS
jgi:hypothetical protein